MEEETKERNQSMTVNSPNTSKKTRRKNVVSSVSPFKALKDREKTEEEVRFKEFSLTTSSVDQIKNVLLKCVTLSNEIREILEKIPKQEDVEEFLSTNALIKNYLSAVSAKNPSDLILNQWESLSNSLKEFKELLLFLGTDLSVALTVRTRRHPLSKMNARIHQECSRLVSFTLHPNDQQQKEQSLSKIPQKDGREFWEKEFGERDVNLIPIGSFMESYRHKLVGGTKFTNREEELIRRIIDSSGSAFVTPRGFGDFLQTFGPLSESLNNVNRICNQPWFFGHISAEEASRLLADRPKGTYLVRFSRSKTDSLALEYVEKEKPHIIRTVPIACKMPDGVSVLEEGGKEVKFTTIEDLIRNYSTLLLKPFTSEYEKQPWFHGAVTVETAKDLLVHRPYGTFMIHFHPDIMNSFLCSYVSRDLEIVQLELLKVNGGYMYKIKDSMESRKTTNEIFPDITTFIKTHSEVLKYNWSIDNVPTLEVEYVMQYNSDWEITAPQTLNTGMAIEKDLFISGETAATYPRSTGGANVLCDMFRVAGFGNRVIMVLADGCGWGERARRAADDASKAALEYLTDPLIQEQITDTISCSHEILLAFRKAHENIVRDKDILSCGTSTLVVGILLKVKKNSYGDEWAFVCASVGDCKAFHRNGRTKKVTDVTFGNRPNVRDAKDCGGRLGPYLEGGAPDLRNLDTFFYPCHAGDIVYLASDGIHDNFDPEPLGFLPSDLNAEKYPKDTWDTLNPKEVESLKANFLCQKMAEVFSKIEATSVLREYTHSLIKYSMDVTKQTREFMENNPNMAEPSNYKDFPGKMDHTTCVMCLVDYFADTKQKKIKKSSLFPNGILKKKSINSIAIPTNFNGKITELIDLLIEKNTYVKKYDNSNKLVYTPQTTKVVHNKDASICSFSTFPNLGTEVDPKRLNDPITEYSIIEITPSRITSVLTSGLNYGQTCEKVAEIASQQVLIYLEKQQLKIENTVDVARRLLKALYSAHRTILKAFPTSITSDTEATLTCGMACSLPTLQTTARSPWIFMCAAIGNIKVFHWNYRTKKVKEITAAEGNEGVSYIDPGGKIGYKGINGMPDSRNLQVFSQYCEDTEQDVILYLSPTVYLNLGPEIMGYRPKDVGHEEKKKWAKMVKEQCKYRLRHLENVINKIDDASPADFVESLTQQILDLTEKRRQYLQTNIDKISKVEQIPFHELPGKLGHATCFAFRVGQLIAPVAPQTSSPPNSPLAIINLNGKKLRDTVWFQMPNNENSPN